MARRHLPAEGGWAGGKMTPERWKQIDETFQAVLESAPAEREGRLDSLCGSDTELRRTVLDLLLQSETRGNVLDKPAWGDSEAFLSAISNRNPEASFAGRRIGPYQLTRELGRGGMGAVYLAERADGQFRQQAAVKLVKRGMDTDFILRRFRQERQILASLNHPYIARLLDGGSTGDGLPYFVMEYVDGVPIFQFASERQLDLARRIELFCKVCEAVASAHARRIVHRDLKPSNIMVTADGSPKLLDFGIAKMLDPEPGTGDVAPTMTSLRIMTPEYASPEQARGLPVAASSDVYSAGIILYELLTGQRPYRFQSRVPFETAQVILTIDPSKPSHAVLERSCDSSTAGTPPASSPESLAKQLEGDLDNIVLTALRKDPAERYSSIEDLRADLLAHVSGGAVKARPFATAEKPVTARPIDDKALAVLPIKVFGRLYPDDSGEYLGVGLADTLITRLSQIRSFSVRPTSSILKFAAVADPFQAGRELGVRYVLDGNMRRSGPLLRVTMQLLDVTREATVWAQQFHSQADDVLKLEDDISSQVALSLAPHLTQTEKRQIAKRGTNSEAAFQAYARGRSHWIAFTPGSLGQARQCFAKAIELDPQYALAYVGMADFHNWAGIYGIIPDRQAIALTREYAERALAIDDELGEAHATYGLLMWNADWDFPRAETHLTRAIELAPGYPHGYEWYGAIHTGLGHAAQGTALTRKAEQIDPLSLRTKTLAAWQRYQAGMLEEALAKADEIVEIDSNYPQGHFQRGNVLEQLGRFDEAIESMQRCLTLMPGAALAVYPLCFALQRAGRSEEARQAVRQLAESASAGYVKPWFLGMAYTAIGDLDRAIGCFEQAFAGRDAWAIWFGTEPKLRVLHRDPRYLRLLHMMSSELAEKLEKS